MAGKIQTAEGTYDYIKATVREDGISLRYKCTELPNTGSDFIDDEGASTWSDNDIRNVSALHLGVTAGKELIEVNFD